MVFIYLTIKMKTKKKNTNINPFDLSHVAQILRNLDQLKKDREQRKHERDIRIFKSQRGDEL